MTLPLENKKEKRKNNYIVGLKTRKLRKRPKQVMLQWQGKITQAALNPAKGSPFVEITTPELKSIWCSIHTGPLKVNVLRGSQKLRGSILLLSFLRGFVPLCLCGFASGRSRPSVCKAPAAIGCQRLRRAAASAARRTCRSSPRGFGKIGGQFCGEWRNWLTVVVVFGGGSSVHAKHVQKYGLVPKAVK